MENKNTILIKFMIFILFIVASLPCASALLPVVSYDSSIKQYEYRDWLGLDIFNLGKNYDIRLIENTDKCYKDCYAIIKINPLNDLTVKANLEGFNIGFKDIFKSSMNINYKFKLKQEIEYPCLKTDMKEGTNKYCYTSNITLQQECRDIKYPIYSQVESICTKEDYKDIDLSGFTFKQGQEYYLKIEMNKKILDNTDWVFLFFIITALSLFYLSLIL